MVEVNLPVLSKIGFLLIGLIFILWGIVYLDFVYDFITDVSLYEYFVPVTAIMSALTLLVGVLGLIVGGNRTSAFTFILMSIPFVLAVLPIYVENFNSDYNNYIFLAGGVLLLIMAMMNARKRTVLGAFVAFLVAIAFLISVLPVFVDKAADWIEPIYYAITGIYLLVGVMCLVLSATGRYEEAI